MTELIRSLVEFLTSYDSLMKRKADSLVNETVIEKDVTDTMSPRLLSSQSVHVKPKLRSVLDIKHPKTPASGLGYDVVNYEVQKMNGNPMKSGEDLARKLQQTVAYLMHKYEPKFLEMAEKLSRLDSISYRFMIAADNLFVDGVCNWGQIAALYAFAATIVKHKSCHPDIARTIAETVGNYVADNLTEWIQSKGGWVRDI